MKQISIAVLVVASITSLIACAPVKGMAEKHTSGQPAPYKAGYHDGCSSGYVAAGHPYSKYIKDVNRFMSDQVYKIGWDDGFVTCKGDYDSIGRIPR